MNELDVTLLTNSKERNKHSNLYRSTTYEVLHHSKIILEIVLKSLTEHEKNDAIINLVRRTNINRKNKTTLVLRGKTENNLYYRYFILFTFVSFFFMAEFEVGEIRVLFVASICPFLSRYVSQSN